MARRLDKSADGQLDALGLRGILEMCRLDVDSVRHDAHDGLVQMGGHVRVGATDLERHLTHIAERLERATSVLDRMIGSSAAEAPVATAALLLAREADHRINGSLQAVIAVLDQQASRAEADTVRDALHAASARVAAIAAVHTVLHAAPKQYDLTAELNLGAYLHRLCTALRGSLDIDGEHRALHAEVEPLTVSPGAARSLGLVVTELVTNALRHAFEPAQSGTVRVNGQYRSDDWYQLCVEDDGNGFPPGFELDQPPSGLGMRMVNMLVDTIPARLTAGGAAGARFVLTLPVEHRNGGGIGRLGARR